MIPRSAKDLDIEIPVGPKLAGIVSREPSSIQRSIRVRTGDSLRITAFSSTSNITVSIITRIWQNGQIITGQFFFVGNGVRTAQTIDIDLTNGDLIGINVFVSSGSVMRGQIFIKGEVRYGQIGATQVPGIQIIANYISTANGLSYPDSPLMSSIDGRGVRLNQQSALAPPATLQVPINTRWVFNFILINFFTSAVVSNRTVTIAGSQGANMFFFCEPRVLIPASQTYSLIFGDYQESLVTFVDPANRWWIKMPQATFIAADQLSVGIGGFGAGDTMATQFSYEEWLDV